jgi:erythronate-4-phosphate dehydrogenase
MIKVVADNKIPFLEGALEKVAKVIYLPGSKISREHLLDADVLIVRTRTRCNEALLQGSNIKFIATATIGYDHIDTQWCEANGITWTNAPGCNSGSVRQYIASALSYILQKEKKKFKEITLGIIGAGNVGSKVQKMARTLGMRVLVNDPPRERNEGKGEFCNIEKLLEESDIITVHVPLNRSGQDKTFHMADDVFFSRMKKGAWFINSSRGEVMQTETVKSAIHSSQLAGVVLDVWENEPDADAELVSMADIATPHIAGYSTDGKANGTAMSVQAISRFFGLGMDDWYPTDVPEAKKNVLEMSCEGKTIEDIFAEVSMFAYDIRADSGLLKSSLATFEEQRGSYPIRREPHALRVRLFNADEKHRDLLRELGYKVSYK